MATRTQQATAPFQPKVTLSNYRLSGGDGKRMGTFSINLQLMPDDPEHKNSGAISLNYCALIDGENGPWIAAPTTQGKRGRDVRFGWVGQEVQQMIIETVQARFNELAEAAPAEKDEIPF